MAALTVAGLAACGSSDSDTTSTTASATASGTTTTAAAGTTETKTSESGPPAKGTLASVTWDMPYGEPQTLDPLSGTADQTGYMLVANLCDGAFWRDPKTGEVIPALATSMSQPDPKTMVITFRDGVKFWDGKPLTMDDVVWSWSRNLDPKSIPYSQWQHVKSITATGPNEVTIKFKQPDALFPTILPGSNRGGAVLEKAYYEENPKQFGTPSRGVMCSGPFEFDRWSPGSELVLKANKDYWNSSLVPKVDQLTFKFVTDTSAVIGGLLSGEFDGALELPAVMVPQLKSASDGHLYSVEHSAGYYILPTEGKGLQDPQVRKALNLALNRQAIADGAFNGAGKPQWGWYTDWSFVYEKPVFEAARDALAGKTQDLAGAKAAFESAGSPSTPIVLGVSSSDQTQTRMAELIQAQAAEAGLNVKIKLLNPGVYNTLYFDPKAREGLDGALLYQGPISPDPLDGPSVFVLPGAIANWINYDNPKVTQDITAAGSELDEAKRAKLLTDAQAEFMGKDQFAIGVVNYNFLAFANNRIGGFTASFYDSNYPWAAALGSSE